MAKVKLNLVGQKYGRLTVKEEVEPIIRKDGRKRRRYKCLCECGKEVTVQQSNLRNGTKSCGCLAVETTKERSITHGLTKTKEYKTWINLKTRCYNPNYEYYASYGGRGITVCNQWLNDYEQFYCDVGPAPEGDKVSIDRIDTDGNYEPSNVRWVIDNRVQAINKRTPKNNSSGCKGVSFHKGSNKWVARIFINSKHKSLGYFSTKEEAIAARQAAEEKYYKPLLETT